jgi:hypothetical protein
LPCFLNSGSSIATAQAIRSSPDVTWFAFSNILNLDQIR